MKIAVIGAGAVGVYVGVRLALVGEDVTFLARGANLEALRGRGRPPKADAAGLAASGTSAKAPAETPAAELEAARKRVAELERKVGQQQLDLDFFQRALRHVGAPRQPGTKPGVTGSTKSSKR